MEKHTVSRLIGAPPGYVGYEEGGQLTEAVRRRPYSVVLFDEIEKAHPEVFNTLLQIFDDGRLTDAQGRTVDFKNTVIIMTSNVGTASIGDRNVGFRDLSVGDKDADTVYKTMTNRVMDAYNKMFRPEFRNRLDEVIVFHHLNAEQILEIVDFMVKRVEDELARRVLKLELLPEAKKLLAKEGYDRQFGARPLRRAVQRLIEDPLAERVLLGDFKAGDTIYMDAQNGEMVFTTEPPQTLPDSSNIVEEVEAELAAVSQKTEDGVPEVSDEDQTRLDQMMND